MKPLCASLSSRGKPDACFALPNLAAAPKPASFCALVALSPAGQGLCLQGFPGTRQCGSITRAMAERSQVCCTPAWQLNGSKSLPHVPGPLLPPPLHQDCSDIHICAGTWGICVHPTGSWWGIPAPSGTLLWEHLPCTLGAAPLLAGCLGEDRKSLASRAKGAALVWDGDGTGQGQGGEDRGVAGAFGLVGRSPLWRGTRRSLLCVSCNKTSPTHQEMTDWLGVGNPAGHKVPPCSCSPGSCPTHLQGIMEDGDTWVIQAGI